MPKDDEARFERATEQCKLLRWLAGEIEAGRAKVVQLDVSTDSEIVEEPRSWFDPLAPSRRRLRKLGTTLNVKAVTLEVPDL